MAECQNEEGPHVALIKSLFNPSLIKQWFSTAGDRGPPATFGQCLETFLIVTMWDEG